MTNLSRPSIRAFPTASPYKMLKMLGITVLVVGATTLSTVNVRAADSLARSDKSFLTEAAESGHAEINASQIALQKSSDAEVKTFAQKMIDDHTKVADDLQKLAASKGVTLPPGPSVAAKAKIVMMGKLSGHTFDKQYADVIGVSAHKDTVNLFKKTSTNAKDGDIKQFAATNLPALQEHLTMATQLKTSVDAKK
ncbi:DUF4142 domain-containing protein [Glaciimonas immobilis]|uniref:Putative membrane protein n=1 Tax=Glaciimonas immobilis TaxID=728004 RepID=A0A840S0I1_9BURK|nr:DUF4142 domain-containing protein [Glaciimonas immobilis]KAF3996319.1 DUF4142 domain-containing protein [Glaciimonas immobilis]MBB5202150.1 putative membrane protein [Glaciimonas immobilis]